MPNVHLFQQPTILKFVFVWNQVVGQALDLGTLELNTMVKDLVHITMDISAVSMYDLHVIQYVVVEKMKTRECVLLNQVKSLHKTVKTLMKTV